MPIQDPGDKKLLDRIDAAIERIRKQVRIDLPYFLTAASKDTALRPSPYNWHKHSFFETDEEHLQHQTWRYREDPDDLGCLTLHGGIEELRRQEEKAQKAKAKEPIRQRKAAQTIARRGSFSATDEESGPSQSANGSPRKKKTSWQDYRKRKLNGGMPSKSPEPAARSEDSRSRRPEKSAAKESGKDLLAVNGVESRDHGRVSKDQHPESSRSSESTSRPSKTNVLKEGTRPVQRDARPTARPQPSKRSPSFDLPDLHSPIHLDEPSDGLPHGFPALLSPLHGLPKQFQEDLEAHKRKRSADDHAGLDTPENKRIKVERNRADSSLSSASSQSRSAPDENRSQSNQTSKEIKSEATKAQPRTEHPTDESDIVTSLIVRLRYGRNKRKDVDRILRARADSKLQNAEDRPAEKIERDKAADRSIKYEDRAPNGVPSRDRANTNGRTSSNDSKDSAAIGRKQPAKAPPAASSVGNIKRARDEDTPEQTWSNKRQQTENTTRKEPETPKKKSEHLSPLPPSKSAAAGKSLPKHPTSAMKDLKSTAMQRNRSQDSVDSTPQATQVTPVPPPRSAPQQNGATPDTKPLTKLNEDLAVLGKRLKTTSDKLRIQTLDSEKAGQAVNPSDWKRGAVAGLESLVAYILMFSALHASCRLSNRPASATIFGHWQTMMPLYGFVEQLSRRDDRLRGLHAHIGLGIAHHIIRSWSELKPEQRLSDQKVASGKYTAADVLNNALAEMPGWSQDAYKFLSDKVLRKEFPVTWRTASSRDEMPQEDRWENDMLAYATAIAKDGDNKFSNNKKSSAADKFRFPLMSDTSSLEVCRFAVHVLKEYAEKEKLDYTMQVRV